jgi:hypothetical protein
MTPPKPIFISDALKEADLPLGTPLNKYQPDWPGMAPPRWMLRRDLKAAGQAGKPDPMLPRGSDHCWCAECGLYFNSSYGFGRHHSQNGCLSVAVLRKRGWSQTPKGHWLPRRWSGAARRAHKP